MSGVPTALQYWLWEDVDPSKRSFDAGRAAAIAERCVAEGRHRSEIEEESGTHFACETSRSALSRSRRPPK